MVIGLAAFDLCRAVELLEHDHFVPIRVGTSTSRATTPKSRQRAVYRPSVRSCYNERHAPRAAFPTPAIMRLNSFAVESRPPFAIQQPDRSSSCSSLMRSASRRLARHRAARRSTHALQRRPAYSTRKPLAKIGARVQNVPLAHLADGDQAQLHARLVAMRSPASASIFAMAQQAGPPGRAPRVFAQGETGGIVHQPRRLPRGAKRGWFRRARMLDDLG